MPFIDLAKSSFTPADVPDIAWIPLSQAHLVVAVGRATTYRWYANDRLDYREIAAGAGALVIYVKAGQVREVYQQMRSKTHAARRARERETLR